MRILSLLIFLLPNLCLADFSHYNPSERQSLAPKLISPFHYNIEDEAVDGCWTGIGEASSAITDPILGLDIEIARATSNYVFLKVKGARKDGICIGYAKIQMLVDSIPLAALYGYLEMSWYPALKGIVAEDSQLFVSADNFNLQILDFTKRFMAEFVALMTSD